jgi:hypothetical protein
MAETRADVMVSNSIPTAHKRLQRMNRKIALYHAIQSTKNTVHENHFIN